MAKNCSTKKPVTSLFLSQNWFVNLSESRWIFSDFFVIFENPVYRLSRNFLIVVRNLFAKTYPNFVTLNPFSKTSKKKENSKNRQKSEKIHIYEGSLKSFRPNNDTRHFRIRTNWKINFGLRKVEVPVFCRTIFLGLIYW